MHATLARAHLLRLLDLVSDAADPDIGVGVPLFTHVRLDVDGRGALRASSASMDRAARATVPTGEGLDITAGACGVPLRRFTSVVRSFAAETITLSYLAGRLRLTTDEGTVVLPCLADTDLDALLMPWAVGPPEDAALWHVNPADLVRVLKAVRYAVSTERGRPALTGVCLDVGTSGATCVATDARRMATASIAGMADRPAKLIIPARALDALLTTLEGWTTPRVELLVHPSGGWLDDPAGPNVRLQGLAVPYPDYRAALTRYRASSLHVTVPREPALALAKRAALLADKDTSVHVGWAPGGWAWRLTGASGDLDALLPGQTGQPPDEDAVTLPFNPTLLVETLDAMPGETVTALLLYDGDGKPIAVDLQPPDTPLTRHVVLRRAA